MKKIICLCLIAILVFGDYSNVLASGKNEEQKETVVSSEKSGFQCELIKVDVQETRDYARNFSYTYVISYDGVSVCTYDIILTYSYTDSTAIISRFKCTQGKVKSGYTVTGTPNKINGNPAYARLTVRAQKLSNGDSITETVQFKCKISGNVDVSTY
ncbi:MAG: hypothetical protein NC225_08510 [Clostridium sp.]|nr:hypothetical protein [Clostridium sp.]MCM1399506.1 hypothetical protein [Clostridium sp.]MCM1460060.1 hypothetical protein [Bacteroides sp.]